MNKTTQYQLNQWEQSDRIMMEDFNADNQKVEQALAGQAEALTAVSAAVAKCGNCKIVYGSYTGNGKYGEETPNVLTFDHKPIFVLVQESENGTIPVDDRKLRMMRNIPWAVYAASKDTVEWTAKGVKWYSTSSSSKQLNADGETYHYMALLAEDE